MIYFDSAATSLKRPNCVIDAVVFALQHFGNPSRGHSKPCLNADRAIYQCRKALSSFFVSDDIKRVSFTKNATEALNIALCSILHEGDHVISSLSEHNSVLRPLYKLQKEKNISIDFLPLDEKGNVLIEEAYALKKSSTRLIVINHASNVTGNVVDLFRLSQIAKDLGALLLADVSQSAGHIAIDMKNMGIDVLCFTGHKALLGPQGTGGIVFQSNVDMKGLLVGGSGVHSFDKTHPDRYPLSLEAGTQNSHAINGLLAGLNYIAERGLSSIHEDEMALADHFYRGALTIDGIRCWGDFSLKNRCPVVSLSLFDESSSSLSLVLSEEFDIATRPGAHCAPLLHTHFGTKENGLLRFSFSPFNTMDEVNFALDALRKISCRIKK